MAYVDFVSELHKATKRDYIGRVISDDKAECAKIAKEYGYDYWDGDRKYGMMADGEALRRSLRNIMI